MHKLLIPAAIAIGAGLCSPAIASDAVPQSLAQRLDRAPAAFAMSEGRRERIMIIQENMARQRAYERRGYGPPPGYGYGYGYGPRPGWGPPPPPRYAPPPPDWW